MSIGIFIRVTLLKYQFFASSVALAELCCCVAGCSAHGGPSMAEQSYFDAYSNETKRTLAWWKRQLDTAQLIRSAKGVAGSAQPAIPGDAAARRDEALRTLRNEYGLTSQELESAASGQISRRIQKSSRGDARTSKSALRDWNGYTPRPARILNETRAAPSMN